MWAKVMLSAILRLGCYLISYLWPLVCPGISLSLTSGFQVFPPLPPRLWKKGKSK